jgi:hypothetical protein
VKVSGWSGPERARELLMQAVGAFQKATDKAGG